MTLTATTELGTQQWVERILGESGAHPMLILAMVTGLMAVGRYFAGPVIEALNPTGVLLVSSVVATLGIYLLSIASGGKENQHLETQVLLSSLNHSLISWSCGVIYTPAFSKNPINRATNVSQFLYLSHNASNYYSLLHFVASICA